MTKDVKLILGLINIKLERIIDYIISTNKETQDETLLIEDLKDIINTIKVLTKQK